MQRPGRGQSAEALPTKARSVVCSRDMRRRHFLTLSAASLAITDNPCQTVMLRKPQTLAMRPFSNIGPLFSTPLEPDFV